MRCSCCDRNVNTDEEEMYDEDTCLRCELEKEKEFIEEDKE